MADSLRGLATARRAAWAVIAFAALSSACSQAPVMRTPEIALPARFKEEATPPSAARSADPLPREGWWKLYGDSELDALQRRLLEHSADLASALARYRQARAASEQLRASRFPRLDASFNTQADRQSEQRPLRVLGPNSPDEYRSTTLGFDLGYEVDLWGRVSNLVASGEALERAAAADLESARLSLQAQLADRYVALRGVDQDVELLRGTEVAYRRALDLIAQRHGGGIASGFDVARAQAQLESTRSQLKQSIAQRALIEHEIASLVGVPASGFAIAPRVAPIALPQVPAGLPSSLLQRRPDIAAAQRRVVAANASVGVARAAFFPTVTLGAQFGLQSDDIRSLLQASNVFWAVGPTLFLSLFDAGRREAEVARARAVLDEAGAKYRVVVLAAFQQVEDSLALIDRLGSAHESERAAVEAAQRSLDLASARYREGAASYLEVVTSQAATLQARRNADDLATRQRRASVQLIRALGGGWVSPGEQPGTPGPATHTGS